MATTKKTTQPARTVKKSTKSARVSRVSKSSETPPTSTPMMSNKIPTPMTPVNRRKLLGVVVLGLILAGLYYARGLFVVAIVNGQPVTRYEVIRDLENQAGQGTVDALVSKRLVRMEAEKMGITISQSNIDARIKTIEDDLKSSGQTLDELLKAQGVTRAEVEEQTELQLMLKKLLADKVKVSDSEVDAALEQQKDGKPDDMSDAEFKKQIRSSLEEQKFAFEAQSYIQELQNKADIKYWHQY